MPDSFSRGEDAGSYVLGLLDPDARQAFETDLARSPDLQRLVTDLQANVEALALGAPPVQPPPRVWNAIAERTAINPHRDSRNAFAVGWNSLRRVRAWLSNGWAVAGVLAVALLAQLAFDFPRRLFTHGATPVDATAGASRNQELSNPGVRDVPGSTGSGANTRTIAASGPNRANPGTALNENPSRLQDRVRILSDQVALLNHVLTQRTALPAGSARLQVFRMVSTNLPLELMENQTFDQRHNLSATPDTGTQSEPSASPPPGLAASPSPDVPLALAMAAARQIAGLSPTRTQPTTGGSSPTKTESGNSGESSVSGTATAATPPAPETSTSPTPTPSDPTPPVVDSAVARDPIQVVDLAQNSPATPVQAPAFASQDAPLVSPADSSAFGAFSVDTGQGAIAFRLPAEGVETGVLQLWLTDQQSGVFQSIGYTSVGNAATAPQVMVMRFSVENNYVVAPTFMVTREPIGGSVVPTGTIVFLPPAAVVTPPSP